MKSVAEADAFRDYDSAGDVAYNLVASSDGRAFGTGLNQPKLLAGRLPDPRNPREAAVDFTLPGAKVGARLTVPLVGSVRSNTHDPAFSAAPVEVSFTVVGIVAVPGQFPPFGNDSYFTGPNYYLTPAFFAEHGMTLAALDFSLIRLRPGSTASLARQLDALGRGKPVGVTDQMAQADDVRRSTHLVAVSLWLLAALLLLVGLLVFGQLLARQIALEAGDYPALRALGMTGRQLTGLAVLRSVGMGAAGGAIAISLAVAFSPLTPIGLARVAEPSPGVNLDLAVLLVAVAGLVVLSALLSAWPAWREAMRSSVAGTAAQDQKAGRRDLVSESAARVGLPVTATVGLKMALERGRGSTSVPVWSTIGAAAVGIGALVLSLTFGASLDRLLASPPLYGVTWDTEIWNNNGPDAVPAATPIVRSDSAIASAAYIQTGLDVRLNGHDVSGFAFDPVKGNFGASVLSGRAPVARDEVALGSNTESALRSSVGETLQGHAENDRAPSVPVHIVGTVVLPPGDISTHLGDGVMVTRRALVRLAGGSVRSPYVMAVDFRPGIDRAAATADLERRLHSVDSEFFTQPPATPSDLVNFGRIQNLPVLLGSILALFALLTLAHLVVTSVRRRRRDFAVMKVMGFAQADIRRAVAWQASTLGVVAVAIGLPLGVIAGRVAWRYFAMHLGVVPFAVTPTLWVLLILPATLVLANVIAVRPARGASRTAAARILREE